MPLPAFLDCGFCRGCGLAARERRGNAAGALRGRS